MIFKTLEIHNIASIEMAFIDFSKKPLSDSEVFLITGKTGSGKTTILDSICLALYAKVPRLENTRMKGETDDSISIKDERQLMRRNSTEAWAILSFEGNNEEDYIAEWYIKRSRKRADGTIQTAKRSLKRVSDECVFTKVSDIEEELKEATGLDFNQFCRTTMLAQGQFTQFLNSDDKDKAAILEKITGVDIYTKIGKKIFEVTKQKREKWELDNYKALSITVLSEEQLAERQEEIKSLSSSAQSMAAQKKVETEKYDWLKKSADFQSQLESAQKSYSAAKSEWEAEQTQKQQVLLSQWNESIEARASLSAIIKADEDISSASTNLQQKGLDYYCCLSGKQAAEKQLEADRQDLELTLLKLDKSADKSRAIENAQTIGNHIKTISLCKQAIEDYGSKIVRQRTDIEALDAIIKSKEETFATKESAHAAACKELKKAEDEANEFPKNKIREDQAAVEEKISNIKIAEERLNNLETVRSRRDSDRKAIDTLAKSITELEKGIAEAAPELEKARCILEERKLAKERQVATVDKWSKKTRAALKEGDTCPICGQAVGTLPKEELLDELFAQSQKAFEEADNKLSELKDSISNKENELKISRKDLNTKTEAYNNDKSLSEAETAAEEICGKLGLDFNAANVADLLAELKQNTQEDKKALGLLILQGEKLENEVKRCRTIADTAREKRDEAKSALDSSIAEKTGKNADLEKYTGLLEQKQKDLNLAAVEISALLKDSGTWQNNWHSNASAFITELSALAKDRKTMLEKVQNLENEIRELSQMLSRIEDSLSKMEVFFSKEKYSASDYPAIQISKLESKLSQVLGDVLTYSSLIENARKDKAELQQKLDAFLLARESVYSKELLLELNKYKSTDIQRIADEIKTLGSKVEKTRSLLESIEKQICEHNGSKPSLSEEDSLESLSEKLKTIEESQLVLQQRLGAVKQELDNNQINQQKRQSLKEAADQSGKDYLRWSKLDKLIGNATGENFRKVAQSYVLASLISAANYYMKTMAPRYTLIVQSGSFVIEIEDAYQGYSRRAVSTISGGESFLVSLSLALALSDIANNLSVDTLFIDEGFGTLSGEALTNAIDTLRALHLRMGRHVGIISHVEELQERIPVQIKVEQEGNSSSSTIRVIEN